MHFKQKSSHHFHNKPVFATFTVTLTHTDSLFTRGGGLAPAYVEVACVGVGHQIEMTRWRQRYKTNKNTKSHVNIPRDTHTYTPTHFCVLVLDLPLFWGSYV